MSRLSLADLLRKRKLSSDREKREEASQAAYETSLPNALIRGSHKPSAVDKGDWAKLYIAASGREKPNEPSGSSSGSSGVSNGRRPGAFSSSNGLYGLKNVYAGSIVARSEQESLEQRVLYKTAGYIRTFNDEISLGRGVAASIALLILSLGVLFYHQGFGSGDKFAGKDVADKVSAPLVSNNAPSQTVAMHAGTLGAVSCEKNIPPSCTSYPKTENASATDFIDDLPDELSLSLPLAQALKQQNAKAFYQVGMIYLGESSVKDSRVIGSNLISVASEKGLVPAQYVLGTLYEKGIGVPKDSFSARFWYSKAAASGNATAMHNIGVLHSNGETDSKLPDFEKAAHWFKRAANLGVRDSQYNLATLYAQGRGLPRDLLKSYKWFSIAAKSGDTEASEKREQIAKIVNPDKLGKIQTEIENWRPEERIEVANYVKVPFEWVNNTTFLSSSLANPEISHSTLVSQVQKALRERGYNVGPIDGMLGRKTISAIHDFQKKHGKAETDKPSTELLAQILLTEPQFNRPLLQTAHHSGDYDATNW